ncbi:MAG: hypothetical protein OEY94_00185 [Alphaproteobacteria bacterium]|nr:hypothetical protein [Alphaproteobacteria bacterium]
MDVEKIQILLNKVIYYLAAVLITVIIFAGLVIEAGKLPEEERNKIIDEMKRAAQGLPRNANLPVPWPAQMNTEYPDFEVIDQDGRQFKISSLRGKVILVEIIDMMNPVSLSYNGAAEYGLFGKAQGADQYEISLAKTIEKQMQGSFSLPHAEVIVLKLIVYNQEGTQPNAMDAESWANFYRLKKEDNYYVVVPAKDFRGEETDRIVPGYQLIDRDFNLRVDAAGPAPKHNFKMSLIPHIPKLAK